MPGKLAPGADPKVQGYYAYTFSEVRKPPSFHMEHTEEWQAKWLEGYDEASKASKCS